MKKKSKNVLHFSKAERRGTFMLVLLSSLILAIPEYLALLQPQRSYITLDLQEGRVLSQPEKSVLPPPAQKTTTAVAPASDSLTAPFPFDPNQATVAELQQLGFPAYLAKRIDKYRTKGGRFYKAEDLLRIYGMDTSLYHRLSPWMNIKEEQKAVAQKKQYAYSKKQAVTVDINTADPAAWAALYGIGPVLSERIVKFRDKLGGFCQIEQVADTYGLPDSTFQKIKPHLRLKKACQKIDINTITVEELKLHPYLNWKQAQVIVAYRDMHGPFATVEDIRKIKALPPELMDKVLVYFKI